MTALQTARMAVFDKIGNYSLDSYKSSAAVCLFNYKSTRNPTYLDRAIYNTQVALFISRLTKQL